MPKPTINYLKPSSNYSGYFPPNDNNIGTMGGQNKQGANNMSIGNNNNNNNNNMGYYNNNMPNINTYMKPGVNNNEMPPFSGNSFPMKQTQNPSDFANFY